MIDRSHRPEPRAARTTAAVRPESNDPSADLPASVAAALAASDDPTPPTPEAVAQVMRAVRARPRPARASAAAPSVRRDTRRQLGARSWPYGVAAASLIGVAATAAYTWTRRPAPGVVAAVPVRGTAERVASAPRAAHFFVLAPTARRVVVVGDFNGWSPAATPMRRDGNSGAWTASVVLPEGRYVYAYVVDGTRWTPDPNAPLAPADGFGRQSSVLVLTPQYAAAR